MVFVVVVGSGRIITVYVIRMSWQIAEWRYFSFLLSSPFVRDAITQKYIRISSAYSNLKVILLLQIIAVYFKYNRNFMRSQAKHQKAL